MPLETRPVGNARKKDRNAPETRPTKRQALLTGLDKAKLDFICRLG
jgi:hypothetical protein